MSEQNNRERDSRGQGTAVAGETTRAQKIVIKSTTGKVLFSHTCKGNTVKKTLEEAVKNTTNLIRADLSGAYLCGADLIWANLSGANLSGATVSVGNVNRKIEAIA